MKKVLFMILGAICIIIASCSKDSGFFPGSDPAFALSKGHPVFGPVINYSPASDGDDTDELLDIFNSAKPGTVIKLAEGKYYVGYMEIYGFKGSLIGAGRDRTIVYPKNPLTAKIQMDNNFLDTWWKMIGGDISISQLTFNTSTSEGLIHDYPEEPFFGQDLFTMFIFADYNANFRSDNSFQKVVINEVNFIGGTDDGGGGYTFQTDNNTLLGIWCGVDYFYPLSGENPLISGDYKITNCYFEHFIDGAEGFSLGENATMSVSYCKFDNCVEPLYFTANYNSNILISGNVFSNSTLADIWIEDVDWGIVPDAKPIKRCEYILTSNKFSVTEPISSVVIKDHYIVYDPQVVRLPMLITLKGNIFNLSDGSTGISALNSQDALIRNNKFSGSGSTGIYVNGTEVTIYDINFNPLLTGTPWAKNVLILGNNFSGLNSTYNIWLGSNSKNCTVVGNGKDSVFDEGTGNKIVGMKNKSGGGHIGPGIRDNFHMWHRGRHH
jgi:hypothetical protein